MDTAEPPHVMVAGVDACPDAAHVEDQLRRGLARAKAPARGWIVFVRIEQVDPKAVRARGNITDGSGVQVAERALSASDAGCAPVARALGVWASLVLDEENARANSAASATSSVAPASQATRAPPTGAAPALRTSETRTSPTPPSGPASSASDVQGSGDAASSSDQHVAPLSGPPAGCDRDASKNFALQRCEPFGEEPRALEVGLGGFIMSQTAGTAFAGATPYVAVEATRGFILRAALAAGESLPHSGADSQWYVARLDACLRWPGLYTRGYGLQIDFCAGSDAGITQSPGATSPYVSLGPSLALSGDLSDRLLAVVRGVGGANIATVGWTGRFELALSWRVR